MLASPRLRAAGLPNANRGVRDYVDFFKHPQKPIYVRQEISLVKSTFDLEEDSQVFKSSNSQLDTRADEESSKASMYDRYLALRSRSVDEARDQVDALVAAARSGRPRRSARDRQYRSKSVMEAERAHSSRTEEGREVANTSKISYKKFQIVPSLPNYSRKLRVPSIHFRLIKPKTNVVDSSLPPVDVKKTLKDIIQECRGLAMAEERMKKLEQAKAQSDKNEEETKREFRNIDRQREFRFREAEWKQVMLNKKLITVLARSGDSEAQL